MRGCLGGSGERERPIHGVSRAREAARRRAAAWRAAVPPPSTLAACLASQAARWSGGRAGPARWASWWATGKVFSIFFCFLFFNTSATLLNLIKYLGNFKNHQTTPGP